MNTFIKIAVFTVIAGLSFYTFAGCSGGGDSATESAVDLTKVVEINVTLPSSSPITEENATVYLYGDGTPVNTAGLTSVRTVTGKVIDLSLMLPAREGEELPTVYLSSLVVPGEIEIMLDSEETALSLLLEGINQQYLQNSETALFVKDLVREEGAAFISYFQTAIETDPYLLRADNIANVLGPVFLDTLSAINTTLYNTFEGSAATTSAPRAASPTLASEVGTYDSNRITIKPSALQEGFALQEVTENGQYTGDLTLWNLSFLPSLYRMTDTSTGEVVKALPTGVLNTAFSPDIFAPTGCPFNILLPNYTLVESSSKNVQLEVYTPGLKNFDSSVYLEEGSPSGALLMRSAYSYAFLPLLSTLLPLEGMPEAAFDVLHKAGVFDDLLSYWVSGDISGGIVQLYKNFNGLSKATLYAVLETGLGEVVENADVVVAILGKKIVTSEISIATAALAVGELKTGLENTPSKITFYATFPVGIQDLRPAAVKKVESSEALPEFTLRGHGFKPFEFQNATYSPSIRLQVCDNEDHILYTQTLQDEELSIDAAGSAITFSLPRYVVQVDTNLSYVKLQLQHAYVDVGWLGTISDYFNTLNTIELPATETLQAEFTIHLSSDLYVSKVDQEWRETGETFLLYGGGFHTQESGLVNEVYFKDQSVFSPLQTVVNEAWENMISANVPEALDLDYLSIGKTFFYVELEDGSRSNAFPLSIVPKPVSASVRGDIDVPGYVYKGQEVTLKQASSVPIYYSLNGSPEQRYVEPVEITESSTLLAYAAQEINGTTYRSRLSQFEYKTCGPGQTYIPYPHGAACIYVKNEYLIPTRYCPINSSDYGGVFYSDIMEVSCSYSLNKLAAESHYRTVVNEEGTSQRTLVNYVSYWTEPEGRPMFVNLGNSRLYNLCPDGSFMPEGGTCSH